MPTQRPEVDRALADRLHEQPIQQEIPEGQAAQWRRQTVERLVRLVVVVLDPLLDFPQALVDRWPASSSDSGLKGARQAEWKCWARHELSFLAQS